MRAELTYESGEPVPPQYCSFDWHNQGWQYLAFPVTIDSQKKLTSLKIFADYSYNTNSVIFEKFPSVREVGIIPNLTKKAKNLFGK